MDLVSKGVPSMRGRLKVSGTDCLSRSCLPKGNSEKDFLILAKSPDPTGRVFR